MPLRVMTFNVFSPGEPEREEDRVPGEREHAWEARAGLNVRTIRRYRPLWWLPASSGPKTSDEER